MASNIKNQLLDELAYEILHTRILRSQAKELTTIADVVRHEQELHIWTRRIDPLIEKVYSYKPDFDFVFNEFKRVKESFKYAALASLDQFRDIDHFIHKKKLMLQNHLIVLAATLKFAKQMVRMYF